MLAYVLGGAILGVVVGHFVPPGYFLWFTVGAVSGCVAQRLLGRRY